MPQSPKVVDQFQERNNTLLRTFRSWLIDQGNSTDQAEAHEFNLDFYLNHYLLYGSVHSAEEGATPELIQDFLGNFFVHKAMWTDVEEQKSSIQSLLVFYAWMTSIQAVPAETCQKIEEMISLEQDAWFAAMEKCSEESLETWQSSDDEELLESGFFSDFDFTQEPETEGLGAEIEAIEIPSLETIENSEDEPLPELTPIDEAGNDLP